VSFLNESKWGRLENWQGHQPEPDIKKWLIDTQSLTKRLKAYSKYSFRVRLDSQQWERPLWSERQALAMPDRGRALVRKVHLLVDETPVVYARTVIPEATLSGQYRSLGHLGCCPLGEVLFADPAMRRERMVFAQIKQGQSLYNEAMVDVNPVNDIFWGRRSLFWLKKESLLVSEFFLPNTNIVSSER